MNSKKSLTPYIKLVSFLGEVLGPDYEVLLQDVRTPSHSVVSIANGHISGREVGAPITDFALKLITDKEYLRSNYRANYNGVSGNKVLRSSTLFIMDEDELIGLLCINFDSSRFLNVSKEILCLCHPDILVDENYNFSPIMPLLDTAETFTDSIPGLIDSVLTSSFLSENIAPSRLTKEEKLLVVDELNQKGVFMVKGSVGQVAQQLHCSEASIYRYLNNIKKNHQKDGS